jgi:sulfonate transport system substrate-binding protein
MAAHITRRVALTALAGTAVAMGIPAAKAADKLRVGKAVIQNFGYIPLDIGMKYGMFEKQGLSIVELNFAGGAKLAQAMTAGAVDISLSAGPEMAFVAKGAPELAVASISNSPAFMGMTIGAQSTEHGIDALKGKKIGVTSPASLTFWLVTELNRVKGWKGEDRATPVVIGGAPAGQIAAIRTGLVYAVDGGVSLGYELEEKHEGRVLIDCSAYVPSIELFTAFATDKLIKDNPDAVRRFLKGWFEAVEYMKTHKAETVAVTSKVIGFSPAVSARTYDALISKLSTTGKFDQHGLETLSSSFVDLKTLKPPIDMTRFYTEKFLPKA